MPVACQTGDRPVEPRVRRRGASAYAGRHILSVLFNTWCSAGPLVRLVWPTTSRVGDRKVFISDTTSIGGLDALLEYKDGFLRGRGNVAGSNHQEQRPIT